MRLFDSGRTHWCLRLRKKQRSIARSLMRLTYIGFFGLAVLVVVIGGVVIRAWLLWRPEMLRLSPPKWRTALSLVGLFALSLGTLAMFGFAFHAYSLSGFGNKLRPVLIWFRFGFWLSVIALVSAAAGRGRTRIMTVVCALIVAAFWIAVAMAM